MSKNGKQRRDGRGRFLDGTEAGPGRPPGRENETSRDLRAVKREWVDAWFDCDGRQLLINARRGRRLSKGQLAFLAMFGRLLPREDHPQQPIPFIVKNPSVHTPEAMSFIDALDAEAVARGLAEVTPEVMEHCLVKHSRGELDLNEGAESLAS